MLRIVFLSLLTLSQSAFANTRVLAEEELALIKSKTVNTHESSATVLVQPPVPTQNKSAWNWQSALLLQSMVPTGTGSIQNDNQYSFESLGSTAFPSLELSLNYQTENSNLKYSSTAKLGYAQQDIQLETTRGYTYEDLKLNSTLTALSFAAHYTKYEKINLGALVEAGQMNYTQSSDSKLARFSDNVAFLGLGFEGSYKLNKKLEALARWTQRNKVDSHVLAKSSQNKNIDIQNDHFEFGVRYAW